MTRPLSLFNNAGLHNNVYPSLNFITMLVFIHTIGPIIPTHNLTHFCTTKFTKKISPTRLGGAVVG